MDINYSETKVILFTERHANCLHYWKINDTHTEQVKDFKYLGICYLEEYNKIILLRRMKGKKSYLKLRGFLMLLFALLTAVATILQ